MFGQSAGSEEDLLDVYHTSKQGRSLRKVGELPTSVGVTPSKELCKCVTSTGILSKGWA